MRLIFFGTADFAVDSLDALHQAGHTMLAVVTAPDKPAGRGLQLKGSPVKEAALRLGLPLLQPDKLKNEEFLAEVKALNADLGVVVAFRMLPEVLWAMPRLGTINLHGSLLPQYRGAAPIHWAVINGETETGVTTFFLKQAIDTGDIIYQDVEPIFTDDTTGDVYDRLRKRGAALLARTVGEIEKDTATKQPQIMSEGTRHAPKITTENSQIPWNQPREQVRNFIRGMAPFPVAWGQLQGRHCRFFKATIPGEEPNALEAPGHAHISKNAIYMACADGWLQIDELQLDGKKRMTGGEVARGWRG